MTTTKTAAQAATSTPTTAPTTDDKGSRRGTRSRRGALEKINAKVLAFNQFCRKWEDVFADSAKGDGTDIVKQAAKSVADKMSTIINASDQTSVLLETLKTNGWKAPKPRGKADHRMGDTVDMKKSKVALFTKGGLKAAQLTGLEVNKVAGTMVGVSNQHLNGFYPATWFVRAQ